MSINNKDPMTTVIELTGFYSNEAIHTSKGNYCIDDYYNTAV